MADLRYRLLAACLGVLACAGLLLPSPGFAACGCEFGGVPQIRKATLKGNDLSALSGHCVRPRGLVDVWVQQKIFPAMPTDFSPDPTDPAPSREEIFTQCVNDCRWVRIAETRADQKGNWKLENLDESFSVQLVSTAPAEGGAYGVLTNVRVRSWRDEFLWTEGPSMPKLEAFYLDWDGTEQSTAFLEARVSNARWMHITIADGPDDGSGLSTTLDMDQDTPNFFLEHHPRDSVVNYTRIPTCRLSPFADCKDWLSLQAPSIHVESPLLGRSAEYPFVLGMVTAIQPGELMFATVRKGERKLSDIKIDVDMDVDMDVDVDIDIDFDLGFRFFSFF